MRSRFAWVVGALVVSTPSIALAQGACPPGSWFCDEQGTPPESDEGGEATEPEGSQPETTAPEAESTRKSAPPIVVYQPPPGSDVIVERHVIRHRRWAPREWGFNLRVETVMMGEDQRRAQNSGMGGLGFSLRYRPVPHFALDAGVDLLSGVDWQGMKRREHSLMLNAMIFFNPRSKLQVYTIGGIGFSGADVDVPVTITNSSGNTQGISEQQWSYFGGQLGLGLEWRVGRKVAINADVLGFIRGRTDDLARTQPEFVDPDTGRVTNSSGGGLVRLGLTFYW